MIRVEILYLLPYFISLGLSLGVLYYIEHHRSAKGALAFFWYVAGQTLWALGFIIELVSPDLTGKISWDGVEWIGALLVVTAFPVFAVQYAEYQFKNPRQVFLISLIIPTLFLILLLTDPWHHLIFFNAHLLPSRPFAELRYNFTWAVYGYWLYSYLSGFFCIALLIRRFFRVHRLYRTQVIIVTSGFLISILGTVLTLLDVHIMGQRDVTPLANSIADLLIAWGFYRYRLLSVVPVGRDRLFEAMVDPVVILDNQNIVVDINNAMLNLLGQQPIDVIGQPAKQIFDNFPIPIKRFLQVSYAREEAVFDVRGRTVHYELTVWPLFDDNRQMTGRIYISHDITAMKDLERELRELNLDLENRVRARTRELAEAYDTTLEGWARALELRDKETEGHSRRVTETTVAVARVMGIPEDEVEHIRRGALLHDIGKMAIPDNILRKAGAFSLEERQVILKHPETAHELLKQIPFLEKSLEIPYCHHERWDGSGYPRGLKGRDIPLSARIFAVADVWDALMSDRPYRKAWRRREVVQYLINEAGRQFDPRVVSQFLQLVEEGRI